MFLLASGIFQIKYLYAGHVYQWGAEQLSYYITFVGGVRAVHLLFVMPHLISSFKPKPKPKSSQSVSVPASDHVDSASRAVSTAQTQPTKPKPTLAHLAKEMNFDLMLLRFSFFIECLSHTLVSLAPTTSGPGVFVGFTTLSCFGAGVIPAANSLALCIMQMQRQASGSTSTMDDQGGAGKLFGALASLQAVGQMILGPLLFGIVFSSTVGTFPKAIFATAAGITVTALALLCLLRPDVSLRLKQQQQRTRQEQLERGRSRISKDLTRSSAGSSPNDADVPLAR
ncbi:hypothetical protein EW026_g2668 [Hermanssonia centrifuga]|uniref:Uncharacterized protein n=1 Tax=Hermanssonia centrifuga TaxID=98765 RepID=A0A4S4KMK4_9APHY|nr:hypothetical protein EW026_g2668 [Hermanssonia centrifuga]